MKTFRLSVALLTLLLPALGEASGQDQQAGQGSPGAPSAEKCERYDAAVSLPSLVLTDTELTMPQAPACLMQTLAELSLERTGDRPSSEVEAELTRVTGLMGKLIDLRGSDAITQLRNADSIEVIDLLAYGAASAQQDTRINSTLLLANIVDNSTVCVVMDHLLDPSLASSEAGSKAQRNLLASVSVVAPWAMKSNYENMQKLSDYLAQNSTINASTNSRDLLENFDARLAYQNTVVQPNKVKDDPALLKGCQTYTPKWAVGGGFTLTYPRQ